MADFVGKLNAGHNKQDGNAVARLLSITNPKLIELGNFTNEAKVNNDIRKLVRDEQWAEIAVCHWRVAQQVAKYENLQKAFVAQNQLLIAINKAAERTDNWILPVMYGAAKELRQLSIMADSQSNLNAEKHELNNGEPATKKKKVHDQRSENLEAATRTINKSFTICLNDRSLNSEKFKKWGVYFFVGELFKIYFKINKRTLASSTLKVLKSKKADLPALDEYPASHAVTFLYYSGVIQFMDEDYQGATENLSLALNQAYKTSTRNQELILMYLIPAMFITTYKIPSAKLIGSAQNKDDTAFKYPVLEYLYRDLFDALLIGDIHRFNTVLFERRKILVKKYLYLSVERIQCLGYTRLFKKTYLVMGKPTRMPIETFSRALAISCKVPESELNAALEARRLKDAEKSKLKENTGKKNEEDNTITIVDEKEESKDVEDKEPVELKHTSGIDFFGLYKQDVSSDQVECYLANMIYEGRMKGYISRERQTLVLSSKEAFPKQVK